MKQHNKKEVFEINKIEATIERNQHWANPMDTCFLLGVEGKNNVFGIKCSAAELNDDFEAILVLFQGKYKGTDSRIMCFKYRILIKCMFQI